MSNKGNILKILQDETAVKHAFYNALALLITSIFCFIVYGVYHVLEIFMRPLLWAILFGTILHPIKSNLTVKLFKSIHDIQYDVKLFERFQNDAEKKTIKNLKSDNQMKIYYTLYKFGLLGVFRLFIIWPLCWLFYPIQKIYTITMLITRVKLILITVFAISSVSYKKQTFHNFDLSHFSGILSINIYITLCIVSIYSIASYIKPKCLLRSVLFYLTWISVSISIALRFQNGIFILLISSLILLFSLYINKNDGYNVFINVISKTLYQYIPEKQNSKTRNIFLYLFISCFIVFVAKNNMILVSLTVAFIILLFCYILVIILRKYPVLYYPYELLYAIEEKLPSSIFESRVLKLLHQIDKMIIENTKKWLHFLVASVLLLFFIAITICLIVIVFYQVNCELMYLAKESHQMIQNQWKYNLSGIIPNNTEIVKSVNNVLQTYSSSVWKKIEPHMQEMNIDGEIKENWDNLVKMLTRNVFSSSVNMTTSNKFEFNDLSAIFSKSTISAISTYISEDIDAIMMYTKSLFSYFRGNATLAFNITYALLEFLVESGSTFFNWIISFSIFMTTLFYVILSERNILTDMEWNNSILQSYICRHLQKSIHVAIRSVFIVSFKMASFYGLYTWLTHSIFDLTFVFLPAVIASILAVIPIVGSYWAVIPGVIQLLFIHENGFYLSIALIMLHLLPMYIIDSSIYSEIKIIHPYLTGLAIIGGVYSFGFEGSVIGPLLLVIMIVIIDVYKKLMSNDSNPYKSYTRNASFG